jgi:acrylyl-CoA reductase (NADPH) / 3-hydroxypropionyl-CoA dehydratase / 3-hydroxypropionyl-CoA synthetase
VITADGGYRNAQIVPFKEVYTDPALDSTCPPGARSRRARGAEEIGAWLDAAVERIVAAAATSGGRRDHRRALDVMRGVGVRAWRARRTHRLDAAAASRIRTTLARALVDAGATWST